MAKAKKTNTTIQTTVDSYAAGIVRRGVLQVQTQKNEAAIRENGSAIRAHVKATGVEGQVAYQAKNGRTLLVNPFDQWNPIHTIEPGALKAPEAPQPPTAEVADSVAELLSKGMAAEAQRLITEAMTGGAQANTAQTATQEGTRAHEILDDIVRRNWKLSNLAEMYGSGPFLKARLVFPHGLKYQPPAIEQETFKSATMGPIKMSREFRKLLLENRDAVQTAVTDRNYNARGMIVSKSRGAIAKYVSELEQRVNDLTAQLQSATVSQAGQA